MQTATASKTTRLNPLIPFANPQSKLKIRFGQLSLGNTIGDAVAGEIDQPAAQTFTDDDGNAVEYTPPSSDQTPLYEAVSAGTDLVPDDITPTVFDPSELEQPSLPYLPGYDDAANGPVATPMPSPDIATVSTPIPDMTPADPETVTVTGVRQPGDIGYNPGLEFTMGNAGLNQELAPSTALSRLYTPINMGVGHNVAPTHATVPEPSKSQMNADFAVFRGQATSAMLSFVKNDEPGDMGDVINNFYNSPTGQYFLSMPPNSQASTDFNSYVRDVAFDHFSGDFPGFPPGSATQVENRLYRDAGY